MNQAKDVLAQQPWVHDYFHGNFTAEFVSVQTWFTEQWEEQKKLPLFEVSCCCVIVFNTLIS